MWDAGSLGGLKPKLKGSVPRGKSRCDPQPNVPGRPMRADWGIAYPTSIPRAFPGRDCASVFSSRNIEWKVWTQEAERARYSSVPAPGDPDRRALEGWQ